MTTRSPVFLSLGRPGSRPPPMYARLLRNSKVDAAWVRYVVGHDELFDKAVPLDGDEAMGGAYTRWLQSLTSGMGLAWSERLTAMPTYLQFRSVGWHADGFLEPFGEDAGQYCYVNLQLAGSGTIEVKTRRGRVTSAHVDPGDMYLFDQRLEHAWTADRNRMCKIFSFAVPLGAAALLSRRANGAKAELMGSHTAHAQSSAGVAQQGKTISARDLRRS